MVVSNALALVERDNAIIVQFLNQKPGTSVFLLYLGTTLMLFSHGAA